MVDISDEDFEELVLDALDKIPDDFAYRLRNVAILIEDFHPDNPESLGLYEGVSLVERTHHHTGFLPDAIFVYREALKRYCSSVQQLADEVEVTVFHEVGHYFGMDEEQLHAAGFG